MNNWIGTLLALAALLLGGWLYGWQGVILSLSVIVFWLLLQFTRLMRVMRAANSAPVGQVDSAVMLSTRLRTGMPVVELIKLTRSLGRKLSEQPETYGWLDAGGVRVEVELARGKVARWELLRPPEGV